MLLRSDLQNRKWRGKWMIMVLIGFFIAITACKKKSSSGGQRSTPEVSSPPSQTVVQGKEVKEGQSVVFQATNGAPVIKATPHTVRVNEPVQLQAFCESNQNSQMSWDLGDGQKQAQRTQLNHVYQKPGTYRVRGICRLPSGQLQEGFVTVTVVESAVPGAGGVFPGQFSPHQNGGKQPIPYDPRTQDPNDPGFRNPYGYNDPNPDLNNPGNPQYNGPYYQ